MNRRLLVLSTLALAFIGATAAFLHSYRGKHRLSEPGVRISRVPMLDDQGNIARSNSIALPLNIPGWNCTNIAITSIESSYLPPDTLFGRQSYTSADRTVQAMVSVVLMGTDRTSIHRPEACLPGQGLVISQNLLTNIPIANPKPYMLPVRRLDTTLQYENSGQVVSVRGVFLYWFVTEDGLTADHSERMWLMAKSLLFRGVLQRWAYVAIYAPCPPGEEDATFHRLSELVAAGVPQFQTTKNLPE
jgi:hypothetical protein